MTKSIRERLTEPFEPSEVKWKPQSVKNGKAVMVCFVDARVVQDRLDDVFGPDGWSTSFKVLGNSSVECTLSVNFPVEGGKPYAWISKADVGGESDQKDETDRMKSAYSDALKRAAVQFGIGRYLYRAGIAYVDYDEGKRQCSMTNEQLTKKYLDPKFGTKGEDEPEPKPKEEVRRYKGERFGQNIFLKDDIYLKRLTCYDVLKKHGKTDLIPEGKFMMELTEEEYEKVAVEARKLAKSKPNV